MSYQDPNFTIITSGGCNSFCSFCTDPFKRKASPLYLKNLEEVLFNKLPKHFHQVSISGGEPTLSPDLSAILGLIKLSNRFDKVVLTTNGTKLLEKIDIIAAGVTNVNVSRHAIGYEDNVKVFGTEAIISDGDLKECAQHLNRAGIDVNLNHVYSNADASHMNMNYVLRFIDYAKLVGATSISFRYDQNENDMSQTFLEKMFEDWTIVREGSCAVCRNHTHLISGMPVVFKASYAEPSKAIDDVYELIYHITGMLTTDWDGKTELIPSMKYHYMEDYKKNPNKEHVAKSMPKVIPKTIPIRNSSLKDVKPVINTLPEPDAYERTPTPPAEPYKYGGGCGGYGGGCGRG